MLHVASIAAFWPVLCQDFKNEIFACEWNYYVFDPYDQFIVVSKLSHVHRDVKVEVGSQGKHLSVMTVYLADNIKLF